jgi:hypothetical protein
MPWEELGKSKVSIDQSNPGISNAVTLTGSIPEYAWFSDDVTKPTPTEDFAWGNEFNKVTGELKVYGWTGVTWVEVV